MAMFSSLLSYPWRSLQKFNQWIADWLIARGFSVSARRVLGVELFGLGFTLMQIGEWALAIACWVLFGFFGFAKALGWGTDEGVRKPASFVRFFSAAGALVLCVLLITITTLRKQENEPWSNLQKLWDRQGNVPDEMVNHPYDLTGERRKTFKALLNPAPDETDILRVGCLQGSDSACVAAGQFLLLLSEAGWKIDSDQVFRMNAQIPTAGVSIAKRPTQSRPPNLPPHLGMWEVSDKSQVKIEKAFMQMGVPLDPVNGPDLPEGTLGVYFGPDPGPQPIRLFMALSNCAFRSESCDVLPITTRTYGTFLTTGSDRQIIHADHPKQVSFQPDASDKKFIVDESELPRTLQLGRCIDHVCNLTVRQFSDDAIILDSQGSVATSEDGKMVSAVVNWKLLGGAH